MNQQTSSAPYVQILRLPQVCKITGLGRSMIYQLEADRRFPHRVHIGLRAVGWVESEVQSWLTTRIERHRACTRGPSASCPRLDHRKDIDQWRGSANKQRPCLTTTGICEALGETTNTHDKRRKIHPLQS
jgi:prophage regulatory protein